jgi:putative ABC transport system permease protein
VPAWPGATIQAVSAGALRDNPGRSALALLGVVLGVALGVAVHLVNASALNEFTLAVHTLSGEADLSIRGPRDGFDESVYPRIARLAQVQAASPAVEGDAQVIGRRESLRIIGLDPFRAAQVQPQLFAAIGQDAGENPVTGLFNAESVLLSHAAAQWLGLKTGDMLPVNVGTSAVELKVAGLLPPLAYRQRIAVMDIGAAQWRLQRLGRINRIELRLRPGTNVEAFRRSLAGLLPAGAEAVTPDADVERSAELSRSYRLNLDMLALVAMFTGAFLVFSTQVLSILRRRSQLALLRVLGLTRAALSGLLIAEGALMGMLGSTLGVALGCGVAALVLEHFGGDLGAGYFRGVAPELHIAPAALAAYWIFGTAFAVIGAAIPAIEAGRRAPALALRAGDEEEGLNQLRTTWAGAALIAAGLILTPVPAQNGLPVFGYTAIALILLGTLLLMPMLTALSLQWVPPWRFPPATLAVAQLQATPRQVAISIGAIVTSFSLMVAMLIMVGSFRQSLDEWLTSLLPADLYVRTGRSGDTGYLTEEQQARITGTPGVEHARLLRSRSLLLTAGRPPVILLARSSDRAAAPGALPRVNLPLIGPPFALPAGAPPAAWISEVTADLHGLRAGDEVRLPIDGHPTVFAVAGIWRDYARQSGSIVIDREAYVAITGDRLANEVALWLSAASTPAQVEQALRERLGAAQNIEITTTGQLRSESLSIFDRTFAVTYALEVVAVLIGLFGVSVSFSAQALARRREFGVLRHIGMTRREIGMMLGCEGALVSALGVCFGLALGWLISLILVHVINRQSFHWSIDMHIPWLALAALAAVLVAAASVTAAWSGRRVMTGDVVSAVREDW